MAKDPAVLFYTQDFLVGSSLFTASQKGYYITLLCYQQQSKSGSLAIDQIRSLMGRDFKKDWPVISSKFIEDENGFYNYRMRLEIERRKSYSDSRKNNRKPAENAFTRVYLIKDATTGYIKIGSSVNPERRLIELRTGIRGVHISSERDYSLLLYSAQDVTIATEFELHKIFKHKQIRVEWFNLDEKDILFIKEFLNNNVIDMSNHMSNHMEIRNMKEEIKEGGTGETKIKNVDLLKSDPSMRQKFERLGYPGSEYEVACADFDADVLLKNHADFGEYRKHFGNWMGFYHKTLDTKNKIRAVNGGHMETNLPKSLKRLNT